MRCRFMRTFGAAILAAMLCAIADQAHAEKRGISAGQFAVAWVLNNRLVTAVIGGPRTEEQWADYLGALAYAFSREDEARTVRFLIKPA